MENSFSFETTSYSFTKPHQFDFLTNIPKTTKEFMKRSFDKRNVPTLTLIAGTTILFYIYDRQLLNVSQKIGRQLGIGNQENTTGFFRFKSVALFRGPTDLGSSLYFLGDGWMHVGIMSGFFISGYVSDNNRALSTASALAHGLIFSTLCNQLLKRTTGRESPSRADTSERGHWRLFPKTKDYQENVSAFDAFPSGHLATAMMTFTVITENYQEYNTWLKPLQYTWLSLLGFEMMNNGVHWISDYPLALAMGYLTGKISVEYGRKKNEPNKMTFYPAIGEGGRMGLNMSGTF